MVQALSYLLKIKIMSNKDSELQFDKILIEISEEANNPLICNIDSLAWNILTYARKNNIIIYDTVKDTKIIKIKRMQILISKLVYELYKASAKPSDTATSLHLNDLKTLIQENSYLI